MPDPQPRAPRPSFQQLLWHGLMGITLGVICAGLLLHVPSANASASDLIPAPASSLKTLRFLLSFAFIFGIGATLTGAMFLNHDKS